MLYILYLANLLTKKVHEKQLIQKEFVFINVNFCRQQQTVLNRFRQ